MPACAAGNEAALNTVYTKNEPAHHGPAEEACPDCGEFELVKCGRCCTCRACGFSLCTK